MVEREKPNRTMLLFVCFRSRFVAELKSVCGGLVVEGRQYISEKTVGLTVLFKMLVVLEDQK